VDEGAARTGDRGRYHLQLEDVGRLASFIASLPTEANMLETTILPIQQRSFIGRG
jgi:hypothetical protein